MQTIDTAEHTLHPQSYTDTQQTHSTKQQNMSTEGSNSVENNGTDQAFHQMGKSGHCQSDPRKLPLKKRFGVTFENG